MSAPLVGLVLAGGESRRMGRDKAMLHWAGLPAASRLRSLLAPFCTEVLLSRAPGQELPEGWSETQTVRDQPVASGPLRGILSALAARPGSAVLAIAVDQPLVDEDLVRTLVAGRDASVHATCFLDSDGTLPDPTCAIYEPSFPEAAAPWASQGKGCPRKVILNTASHVLPSPGTRLRDADSPEDRAALSALVGPPARIVLEHFASMCEKAGAPTETVTTSAQDIAALWEETSVRLELSYDRAVFQPARNDEFVGWDTPLADGDRISFLPPFAGG